MAMIKRLRTFKPEDNTGFGANSSNSGGRFYDRKKDRANVVKRGVGILDRYSWYHTFLGMSRGKFLVLIFSGYVFVNLIFAIATGLFYGRFSRPRAFLEFSDNALIAPYKDGAALMFRMAPYKNNNLSEAEVKITLGMQVEEDGRMTNRFYPLNVEISNINSLALSWTVVHAINEK